MATPENQPGQGTPGQPLPGSVVAPGVPQQPASATPAAAPSAVPPTSAPAPLPPLPAVPPPEAPTADTQRIAEDPSLLAETGEVAAEDAQFQDDQDDQRVSWTASEFVAHDKSAGWYVVLVISTLLLAAAIFFLTRDVVSTGVIIIAAFFLGVYASHKPRQLQYVVDQHGIGVGQKYHTYDEFRSFSVASDGAFASLVFMPLRRFALPLTIYYAPVDEDRILDILSDRLPLEEHREDAVDSLMKRIRF